MAPPGDSARCRPLVVRFGAIGDMIVLSALVQGVGQRYGTACDVLGSGGAPRQVYAHLPEAGEVVTIGSRRTPYWLSREQRRLVAWLRRRGASPAWVVEDMEKVLWLLERGGLGTEHLVSMREVPRGDLEHTLSHLHRMLRAIPAAWRREERPMGSADTGEPETRGGGPLPCLVVTAEEREDCRRWIDGRGWTGRPLVLMQTQSRRVKRGRWPEEHWRAVAGAVLGRRPEARVVLIGSPDEEAALASLAVTCDDTRVEVAASDLPLRRLFALCEVAHSCVSLDTGPAHAAAALGCPVAVLVGMADPRRNHPVPDASPVRMVTSVDEARWPGSRAEWEAWHRVEEVAVDPVVAAWEEVATIGRGGGGGVGYLSRQTLGSLSKADADHLERDARQLRGTWR